MSKQAWILVGGNGSGKSSFHRVVLQPKGIAFVNADLIARTLSSDDTPERTKAAQKKSLDAVYEKIANDETFAYETVFSHESKVQLIHDLLEAKYGVILVVVGLRSPELNEARVMQRVRLGGHDVPRDKIGPRLERMFENVKLVLKKVDHAYLIDNSVEPLQMKAKIKSGKIELQEAVLNPWVVDLLKSLK